jgi:S1-C subfamily serine protease
MPELQDRVSRYRPGDAVPVVVLRNGKRVEAQVELRDAAGATRIVNRSESEWQQRLGAVWTSTEGTDRGPGVLVYRVFQGAFRQIGVQEGFLIQSVNGEPVSGPSEWTDVLSSTDGPYRIRGNYPDGAVREYILPGTRSPSER